MTATANIRDESGAMVTIEIGRNVEMIRTQGVRLIVGSVRREIRAELSDAVKQGLLGHMKKDGLRPETYFHPDQRNAASERRDSEAQYAIDCIARVMAPRDHIADYRDGVKIV
jgi:hypothetical protein